MKRLLCMVFILLLVGCLKNPLIKDSSFLKVNPEKIEISPDIEGNLVIEKGAVTPSVVISSPSIVGIKTFKPTVNVIPKKVSKKITTIKKETKSNGTVVETKKVEETKEGTGIWVRIILFIILIFLYVLCRKVKK